MDTDDIYIHIYSIYRSLEYCATIPILDATKIILTKFAINK